MLIEFDVAAKAALQSQSVIRPPIARAFSARRMCLDPSERLHASTLTFFCELFVLILFVFGFHVSVSRECFVLNVIKMHKKRREMFERKVNKSSYLISECSI